jgi:hypothetical protein
MKQEDIEKSLINRLDFNDYMRVMEYIVNQIEVNIK